MKISKDSKKFRMLLVEDDDVSASLIERWVSKTFDFVPLRARSVADAKVLLAKESFSLILCDLHLPDGEGFEVVAAAPESTAKMIITADGSLEHAMSALDHRVDAFILKPLEKDSLFEKINKVIDSKTRAEAKSARPSRRILAVGAHPDDVEIGCGGTLSRYQELGDEITLLTLTLGAQGGDARIRQDEAQAAADRLGAHLIHCDLKDTQLHLQQDLISTIEMAVRYARPDILYTHSAHDRHQDHRSVNQATLVAARHVKTLFCYQSPSTTVAFSPSRFVDISDVLEAKIKLIEEYRSQSDRDYMQKDIIRSTARYWSRFSSGSHSEPFEVLRESAAL